MLTLLFHTEVICDKWMCLILKNNQTPIVLHVLLITSEAQHVLTNVTWNWDPLLGFIFDQNAEILYWGSYLARALRSSTGVHIWPEC